MLSNLEDKVSFEGGRNGTNSYPHSTEEEQRFNQEITNVPETKILTQPTTKTTGLETETRTTSLSSSTPQRLKDFELS